MKKETKQMIIALLLAIVCCIGDDLFGQNVVKDAQGNYKAIYHTDSAQAVATGAKYEDRDGTTYPVYQSKRGKLFVRKVSKTTGKTYNYYLKD